MTPNLEELFALCADMICCVDAGGLIRAANPAFCAAAGLEARDVTSRRILDLVHDDDREELERALDGAREGGRIACRLRSKEGTWLEVEWTCQTSPDSGMRYLKGADVTGRRPVESALEESRETILALFENAAQGILTVDAAGCILSFNAMAERLFGYTREEIQGQKLEVLMPAKLSDVHERHRRDYFASPRTRPMGIGMDLVARRKNGSEFPVEISLSPLRTREGAAAVAFVNDVSERKRSESERARLQQQLEHAIKMEAVGRLAGGIAHDFNNLLTALSGFAEIVLDELPEGHPLREGAKETLKTCQRSTSLVRRLLAVSRRQMLQLQVMDLNPKIVELEKMLRGVLGEDIDLVVSLEPGLGFVRADESQVEQVLLNLVVNSRDAMPTGGRLVIRTENVEVDQDLERQTGMASGSYVLVTVSDTGIGMDRDTLQHVFEPFFTTKERGKGTGLGLATVYGIVNQSGGHVAAESEPGRGTTFRIYLPRVRPATTAPPGSSSQEHGRAGSETILVVEDENTVRLVAVANLRKAGYRVLEAAEGEEALRLAEAYEGPIHLVLTDVLMPGIHGPALVKQLGERRSGLRVLYMSGHADDALLHHGVLEGGIAFLEKPFTRDALVKKVREALDAS